MKMRQNVLCGQLVLGFFEAGAALGIFSPNLFPDRKWLFRSYNQGGRCFFLRSEHQDIPHGDNLLGACNLFCPEDLKTNSGFQAVFVAFIQINYIVLGYVFNRWLRFNDGCGYGAGGTF